MMSCVEEMWREAPRLLNLCCVAIPAHILLPIIMCGTICLFYVQGPGPKEWTWSASGTCSLLSPLPRNMSHCGTTLLLMLL